MVFHFVPKDEYMASLFILLMELRNINKTSDMAWQSFCYNQISFDEEDLIFS